MDCVESGDWLIVNRGPLQTKKEGGVTKQFYAPEYEGLLLNVIAVSPPIMLVRLFPFHTMGLSNSVEIAWHWDRQRFSRATPKYVEEYLRIGGWNPDGTKVKKVKKEDAPSPAKRRKKKVELILEVPNVE